jgi:tetratricopeptide (TPR) repeat protein
MDSQTVTTYRAILRFAIFFLIWLPLFSNSGFTQAIDNPQVQKLILEAKEAEKSGNYKRAAEVYVEALKILPKWAYLHQSLGIVYHLQAKYPEAITSLESALRLDPKLWGSLIFLGLDYYRTNQFSKAAVSLEKALQMAPPFAEGEARQWLGASYLALDRFEDAMLQYRRLVELNPKDLELLNSLAQTYSQISGSMFKEIGKINSESAEARRLQAEYYESQDRPDRAIDEFTLVRQLRPDWEGVNLALGNLFLKQEKLKSAAEALEQELELAPGDPQLQKVLRESRDRLRPIFAEIAAQPQEKPASPPTEPVANPKTLQGVALFREGKYQDAQKLCTEALASVPGESRALLYKARTYFVLGNYTESISLLQQMRQKEPKNLEMLYWLGKSYQELAGVTVQKMINLDPSSYRIQLMNGELLEGKTQYAEALKAYQEIFKSKPDFPGIRYIIGNVYYKMWNLDEALNWLTEELKRNPFHNLANYRVGSIHLSKASPDLAIPFLEKAVHGNPGLIAARQELAKAYMAVNRYQEAIDQYKQVAEATPDDETIHYQLSTAYRKIGDLPAANAEMKIFGELRQKKTQESQEFLRKKITRQTNQ